MKFKMRMTTVTQTMTEIDEDDLKDGRLYADEGNLPEGFVLVKDDGGDVVMVFFDDPVPGKAERFVRQIQEQAISTNIHFPEIEE